MSDEDIKEYHNIGKKPGMKKSNKYNYMDGKQITDPDTGKRVYEISTYRLPSVTTVLGATKNTEFLTKWKAKVGETEAERIKNVSSARGTSMHKFLESYVTGVGYDDLTELGRQASPMAKKIIEIGFARSGFGRRLARWEVVLDRLRDNPQTSRAIKEKQVHDPIDLTHLESLEVGTLGQVFRALQEQGHRSQPGRCAH